MADLEEYLQDQDARVALTRALRQLDEAKKKKAELVEAVYQAARDAASGIKFIAPSLSPAKASAESAVLLLADWQLGKVTPSYSSEVCAKRIKRLGEKVVDLTEIQRAHHPVPDIHVLLLGDLVEGELIFPGQAHRIDASLFRQVMLDGPSILGGLIGHLLENFTKVSVTGVIGNHGALGGRSRREMHPESNADAMLYEATRIALGEQKGLSWNVPQPDGERAWFAIEEVRGKRFFMFHGDQARGGFAGYPWYAFGKKLGGWHHLYGPFDYAVSGHYHTAVRASYPGSGNVIHWGAGSPESDNTYAAEMLAASGEPTQQLLYVGKGGVTAEYQVRL